MNTPTLDEFKKWTRDVAPAARAVLMARAFAEVERERVNAYILPIFQSYKFPYAERWRVSLRHGGNEFVEKPDDLYLAEDESARVRIEDNRPMPEMTILRLASMLRDEWPRELERLNAKSKK